MLNKIKKFIRSKRFLQLAIAVFAAQAIFLSFVVPYKAPSDEEYHFRFTQYYADRSWFAGPVIADQFDNFDLGDIQRAPGYLYHYLSSFVLRLIQPAVTTVEAQVVVLRLLNVGLGVAAIMLMIGLLRRLKARGVVINLVVAWLTITTMFIWLFAGLNYDNLAMVLFFALLHSALSVYQSITINKILGMVVISFALMLTKETFLPPIFIAYLLLAVGLFKKHSVKQVGGALVASLRDTWRPRRRMVFVLLSLLVVVMAGLFAERYGQNYLQYQRTTPACNKVHTEDECMQHGIYRRNTGQRQEYLAYLQSGGSPSMNFLQFTRTWTRAVYDRIYGYRGMNTIHLSLKIRIIASVVAVIVLGYAIRGWRTYRLSILEKGLLIVSVSYVVLVFLYNYNIYRYYGYPFAIQGRYILPVLPFLYYFIVVGLVAAYAGLKRQGKNIMVGLFAVLLLIVLIVQGPIALYIRHGEILRKTVSVSRQIG